MALVQRGQRFRRAPGGRWPLPIELAPKPQQILYCLAMPMDATDGHSTGQARFAPGSRTAGTDEVLQNGLHEFITDVQPFLGCTKSS